jgi:hypothetical protein
MVGTWLLRMSKGIEGVVFVLRVDILLYCDAKSWIAAFTYSGAVTQASTIGQVKVYMYTSGIREKCSPCKNIV